jgi:hypothetical protein
MDIWKERWYMSKCILMSVVFSTFIKLTKKFHVAVNELEGFLLCEQNPTTGNNSKPAESSRLLFTLLVEN